MKTLFYNANLVIDDYKQAQGAILIYDDKIEKVYLGHFELGEIGKYHLVNVKGNYLFPNFINTDLAQGKPLNVLGEDLLNLTLKDSQLTSKLITDEPLGIDLKLLSDDALKIVLKTKGIKNLYLIKPEVSDVKRLIAQDLDECDVLALTSLNLANILNLSNRYATLTKGKFADFLILDANYDLVKCVNKGVING